MKKVKIIWDKDWGSEQILNAVIQQAGPQGISYADIKKRMRLLDVMEKMKEGDVFLCFEDADWETLKAAVENFKYGAATRGLMKVLDTVLEAKDGNIDDSVSEPGASVPEKRVSDRGVDTGQLDKPARNPGLDGAARENGKLDTGRTQSEYVER